MEMNIRLHAVNRILERGVSIDAVRKIADQEEVLLQAQALIAPIANNKVLKFRFHGTLFTATDSTISMVLKVESDSFVIGLNKSNNKPVIVTAWSNR